MRPPTKIQPSGSGTEATAACSPYGPERLASRGQLVGGGAGLASIAEDERVYHDARRARIMGSLEDDQIAVWICDHRLGSLESIEVENVGKADP